MNKRKKGSPEPIGSLIEGLLRARGLFEGVERGSVFSEWEEFVGPEIARVAKPVGFDRSVLFVEVRSSAWLMELEMMERRILAQINASRRRGKFDKIVFRLAAGEASAEPAGTARHRMTRKKEE
jgi:predicted nucleic acid-binding Zn ribbon protein